MKLRLHLLPLLLSTLLLVCGCAGTYMPQRQAAAQLPVSAAAPDTAVERIIAPYKAALDKKMEEVIGFAPEDMPDPRKVRHPTSESKLGNFVTDLMREQAQLQTKEAIDLGVTTNGGLRNTIPKGNLLIGTVYELMPFENELVVIKVPGAVLQKLFEMAAATGNVPMSGARYSIQGKRAFDIRIGGQPLDPDRVYTVAISDYLANGGDNFIFFKGEKQLILGITVRDAILRHIRALTAAGKPVAAAIESRVQGLD